MLLFSAIMLSSTLHRLYNILVFNHLTRNLLQYDKYLAAPGTGNSGGDGMQANDKFIPGKSSPLRTGW